MDEEQARSLTVLLFDVAVGKRGAVRSGQEPSIMALNFIGCGAPG
jgi:hypothetical protein